MSAVRAGWIVLLPLAGACNLEQALGPPRATPDDVAAFERGFVNGCVGAMPLARPETAKAACECTLQAMYAGDDHGRVAWEYAQAMKATGQMPPAFQARAEEGMIACGGEAFDEGLTASCTNACADGAGEQEASCATQCSCVLTALRAQHPGAEGTRWMLAAVSATTGPTADGQAALDRARASCPAP